MGVEDPSVKGAIPSRHLEILRSLIGVGITDVTRYSWCPPEQAGYEYGVSSRDVFSLTAGPVAFTFDSGLILGVASDPSLNSVLLWVEKSAEGQLTRHEPLSTDEELYPVSATDSTFASDFWRQLIGAKVNAVSILLRAPESARLAELPNEVGLCFDLGSGIKVVAAHGLHDDSDDFAIIPYQLIMDGIRSGIDEVVI